MYHSIFRPDLFANQTILITGGGTGIGRVIAHELASLGATVLLAARKIERLEATAAEIGEAGGRAFPYLMNIRDEQSVADAVGQMMSDHKVIHGLVNNAGGQFPSPAEQISPNGWRAVIDTNLNGTFLVTREVFKQTMKQNGGAIVNIVADMWRGFPVMSHTGAARAGVVNLTQSLAVEWAAAGVRVNAVAPGVIEGHGISQYDEAFIEGFIKEAKQRVPAQRLGTESEIAAAVTFLLSPAAAYITGETIKVDGGSSLWGNKWEIGPHDRSQPFDGF